MSEKTEKKPTTQPGVTAPKPESPKAQRKLRTSVVVQQRVPSVDGLVAWADVKDPKEYDDAASAEKWIAESGVEGETYRVARVYKPVKVQVEQTPTRRVVSA